MILCCDFGSNSTSHAFSWKPYRKFCMRTKNIATSHTGCLATAQQNSDRNVSDKDHSYNMYVMSIKIHFSPRKEYQTVHEE